MPTEERHAEVLSFLALVGHGELLDTIAEEQLALEKAVSDVGKAGEITIKIKITPNGGNKRMFTWDVKNKKPAAAGSASYAFASHTGQYLENNPDQQELPLRTVNFDRDAKNA